ncbi:hypothetical protein PVL29_026215 [Vitis rotundifolia]|uniref:MADS-box domain-containing protein n=1 Tax=Vitis rotundifolia TaxID=103349 RepID=A0AA38YM25_VITRO|nr:hypothetical protein PVL29_026215 [Vitis rotundifolia]
MKRIPNEENRLITFSKCRFGIYKKASKLSTLCDAEVGVLDFSLASKAFSFGHPSIETIKNKVLYENPPSNDGTLNLLKRSKRRSLEKKVPKPSKGWWEEPISELGMHEPEQMPTKIQMLRKHVQHRANELRTRASSSSLSFSMVNQTPATNPFFMTKVEQKY